MWYWEITAWQAKLAVQFFLPGQHSKRVNYLTYTSECKKVTSHCFINYPWLCGVKRSLFLWSCSWMYPSTATVRCTEVILWVQWTVNALFTLLAIPDWFSVPSEMSHVSSLDCECFCSWYQIHFAWACQFTIHKANFVLRLIYSQITPGMAHFNVFAVRIVFSEVRERS